MALRWNSQIDSSGANANFNCPIGGEGLLGVILRGHLGERAVQLFWNGCNQPISKSHRPFFTAGGVVGYFSGSDAGGEPNGRCERNRLWAHGRRCTGENGAPYNDQDKPCQATAAD